MPRYEVQTLSRWKLLPCQERRGSAWVLTTGHSQMVAQTVSTHKRTTITSSLEQPTFPPTWSELTLVQPSELSVNVCQ